MSKFFQEQVAKKIQTTLNKRLVGKTIKGVRLVDDKYTSPYVELIFSAKKSILFQYNDIKDSFLFPALVGQSMANPKILKSFKKRFKCLIPKPPAKKKK